MLKFLGRLFGAADRVEVASDRLALAVEGIADDLEKLRASLRDRLGLDSPPATAVPALPAPEDSANGRRRGKAAPAA
jgi:hypothetical protein